MALQAENYALEKQLHSYQQSIARSTKTSPSETHSIPNGRGPPNGSTQVPQSSSAFNEMARRWESGK